MIGTRHFVHTLSTPRFPARGAFIALVLTLIACSGLSAERAHAEVIASQTAHVTQVATSSNAYWWGIGTGLSGTVQSMTVWGYSASTTIPAGSPVAAIACYNDSNYTDPCASNYFVAADDDFPINSSPWTGYAITANWNTATTGQKTLQSDKYYALVISTGGTGNVRLYGQESPNTCLSQCTGSPYFVLNGNQGINESETYIVEVLPENASTSTPETTIETTIHVKSDDAPSWYKAVYVSVTYTYQQNPFDPIVTLVTDGNEQLNTGTTQISTTTTLAAGTYQVRSRIGYRYFGGTVTGEILDQQTNVFTVGTSSLASQAFMNLVGDTYDYIANADATTTQAFAQSCYSLANFDAMACITYMLFPNPQRIDMYQQALWDTVKYKPPFGYVTLTMEAFSSVSTTTAATSSLPALVIDIPAEQFTPLGNLQSVNLTPWDRLLGSGSILAEAESYGNDPKTIREIVETGWETFVYLLFGLIVFFELIGMGGVFVSSEARISRYQKTHGRI